MNAMQTDASNKACSMLKYISRFPLTWKTLEICQPGKLLEFLVW